MAVTEREGWRFWTSFGEVRVVRGWEKQPEDEPHVLRTCFARGALDGWVRDPTQRITLLSLYGDLVGAPPHHAPPEATPNVAARLERAFDSGEIVALQIIGPAIGGGSPEPKKEDDKKKDEPAKEKTWIRIKIIDPDDKPVAGVAYEMKVTDGSMRKGKVDNDGEADIDGIDPGTCELTLTELDAGDWRVE